MNKKVLSFVNKLEGYKTAIKELHWDSDSLSQHELCDKIAESIAEFQDTVSEVEQSITGKLAIGNLKPVSYKVTSLKKFVEDVLDATNSFYKSIEDEGDTYTGMRSDCESFLSDMQRNLYLVNFTMKEDLKRRLASKLNEGYRKEENIKTTFHGTKPSTEKGMFKRINDLTKNGQLNTRVFSGLSDAFEFYQKILGAVGNLHCLGNIELNVMVQLDANNNMSYFGIMRAKEVGEGQYKASITFSPHSDETEQPDPEMSEPTIEDGCDNFYEIHFNKKSPLTEAISAHDIFREVKSEVFNLMNKGEMSVPVTNGLTREDCIVAYWQQDDKITVKFKGQKRLVPCDINSKNEDYIARCIMSGFAQIVKGVTLGESVIRITGNELHKLVKESVQKILESDYQYNPMDLNGDSVRAQYAGQIEREENKKKNIQLFVNAFKKIRNEYGARVAINGFLKFVEEVEGETLYDKIWEKYGGEYEELADQYLQNIILSKRKRG